MNTTTENSEENTVKEELKQPESQDDYIGEEEQESNNDEQTQVTENKDEKAIELAKKEYGEDDTSVTYSIERKDGNKYYVAVKSDATVVMWYEVDTDTWEISEY